MKVAFLTSGGIAPCLTSSIISLIKEYRLINENINFIGYLHGYKGLLKGHSIDIPSNFDSKEDMLYSFGGTFLGNSRVKLTNVDDCIKNNYINENEIPVEVAANQLIKDGVQILHTIGGDDTNTTAADLVKYLKSKNYELTVVGLPKTIDNDVYPISQTLGALTAAEQTALFFENIVNENTTSSRQLIIHEVMGRNCGWLTAYSSFVYKKSLKNQVFFPEINLIKEKWDIHAIYIPELKFNLNNEVLRLQKIMDNFDCVNIFLSEGAGIQNIINEKKNNGEEIKTDAFGHYRLDDINPGKWYADYFKKKLKCNKVLVQKSGYFARSAKPNIDDIALIKNHAKLAVKCALDKCSGVIGLHDDNNELMCIDFENIKGGKPFDSNQKWFLDILSDYNQI